MGEQIDTQRAAYQGFVTERAAKAADLANAKTTREDLQERVTANKEFLDGHVAACTEELAGIEQKRAMAAGEAEAIDQAMVPGI